MVLVKLPGSMNHAMMGAGNYLTAVWPNDSTLSVE